MDVETFKKSTTADLPPENISVHLKAMWYDGKGDWAKAHGLVDNLTDLKACWVHAYLHRKEGDTWNADYWYRKAGKSRPDSTLQAEWQVIVETLL